ncbi:hypothetical protein F5Y16DRAFT_31561 [Xylariaceae sp. FL0255]|nr:hypothetical protein F5Y16DRAFT_31561 [Xylariaceae sp. FL0255]
MKITESSTQLLWGVTVLLLLAAGYYQLLLRAHSTQRSRATTDRETQRQHAAQDLTLRVDLVPTGTSCEDLQEQLRSIIASSPELQGSLEALVVRSIAPRDSACACATVTIRALLPVDQLLARLRHAGKAFPYRYDCTFHGITPLYEDVGGVHCDVIAVPGLASHAIGSWKSPGGNDLWLRDWLSKDVLNIRVLLYGYDTKLLKSNAKSSLEDLGRSFLESLTAFRTSDKTERRPIILLGHSMGGLLIKEALVHASRSPASSPTQRLLSQTCCGLLFFGVPQLGLRNEKLVSLVEGQPNQALIHALVVDEESEPSDFLGRMSDDFARCFQGRLRVVSFYERKLSATVEMQPDGTLRRSGPHVLLVTKKSATSTGLTAVPDDDIIPLDADHSGLVKFESRRDDAYVVVKERIKNLVLGAATWHVDPPAVPTPRQNGREVAIQHGSAFGGQYVINGGNFSQGNVMNI